MDAIRTKAAPRAFDLRRQRTIWPVQRRTFLGLQRTPTPRPHIQGLLVAQGLAVVLLVDYAVAVMRDDKTTTRSTLQFFGLWQDAAAFGTVHSATEREKGASTIEKER